MLLSYEKITIKGGKLNFFGLVNHETVTVLPRASCETEKIRNYVLTFEMFPFIARHALKKCVPSLRF